MEYLERKGLIENFLINGDFCFLLRVTGVLLI